MIYGVFKARLPKLGPRSIVYRSMKHFDEEASKEDIEAVTFHICKIFDDSEDSYWALGYLYSKVVNMHLLKRKYLDLKVCLI